MMAGGETFKSFVCFRRPGKLNKVNRNPEFVFVARSTRDDRIDLSGASSARRPRA